MHVVMAPGFFVGVPELGGLLIAGKLLHSSRNILNLHPYH